MQKLKFYILLVTSLYLISSCSKPKEEAETCEDTRRTKVTYVNTGTTTLRVVVSTRLTPQFEPIDPIFTIDLLAGQSVAKEFEGGRYINSWYNSCSSDCKRIGSFFRDFDQCNSYEEKQ